MLDAGKTLTKIAKFGKRFILKKKKTMKSWCFVYYRHCVKSNKNKLDSQALSHLSITLQALHTQTIHWSARCFSPWISWRQIGKKYKIGKNEGYFWLGEGQKKSLKKKKKQKQKKKKTAIKCKNKLTLTLFVYGYRPVYFLVYGI